MIRFPRVIDVSIRRYGSGEVFSLVRGDSVPSDKRTCDRLVSVCNEPLIYSSLFRDLFAGRPYSVDDANGWLTWVRDGWLYSSHFAFVVLDDRECIVAACDIKCAQPENAEIGYWCSATASGVMSNAARAMIDLAARAGFQSFIAYTRPGNVRSEHVLDRLGFSRAESVGADGRHLHRYHVVQSPLQDCT